MGRHNHFTHALRLLILIGVTCALIGLIPGSASAQTPEIRAYWVDASHIGAKSSSQIDSMLSIVRSSNMNTVVVQMRKRGNTYYPSNYDPWAPDANTSFDALAYLIQQAHNGSPRIEVHCWFATLAIWGSTTPPAAPNHVFNAHPDWLSQDAGGATWDGSEYWLDPGVPIAQQYTNDVIMDVVNRYSIDGIHVDLLRYSGNTWGYNPTSVQRFNDLYGYSGTPASNNADWLQFRRDQVTALMRKVYVNVIAAKPSAKVSASTVTWGSGPTSDNAWYSAAPYASVLQDWRSWMEEGILDINMPMTYYDNSVYPSYYDNWIGYEKSHKYTRHLAIGVGGYINSRTNSINQLLETRTAYNGYTANGQILFSYYYPWSGGGGQASAFATDLRNNLYGGAVSTPSMSWKTSPTKGYLRGTITDGFSNWLDGASVTISGPQGKTMATDGTGFYAFANITPGAYTVTASFNGLPTQQTTIGVNAGQVSTLNISLCDLIIDNTSPGFSASANWATGTMSTDKYGTDYRYRSTQAISDMATWTPNLPGAGNYAVYAWWPQGANRSPSAPYRINYNGGTATVYANQQINGGQWNLLGTYNFLAGTAGNVQLSCWATTGYNVMADAVRFVKQ